MRQAVVQLGRELTRQRPTQSHEHQSDVAESYVRAQRAILLSHCHHSLYGFDRKLPPAPDLFVTFERDVSEQRRHHRRDAEVDGLVHVPQERMKRVRLLGERFASLAADALEHVDRHRAHERFTIRKTSVQCGNTDARAARHLIERRIDTLLDEHVARRGKQLFAIAPGVSPEHLSHTPRYAWRTRGSARSASAVPSSATWPVSSP